MILNINDIISLATVMLIISLEGINPYYKFKKIIENQNFFHLFKRNVNRFKTAGYILDIMRQTACLVFNPVMAMLHSLVARRWFRPQTQ